MQRACFKWVKFSEEGCNQLPDKFAYYSVAHFQPSNEMWSVIVKFDEPPINYLNTYEQEGYIRFLIESAPEYLLRLGNIFSLHEGPHRVADVQIIYGERT